jgi:hypothetical protein
MTRKSEEEVNSEGLAIVFNLTSWACKDIFIPANF